MQPARKTDAEIRERISDLIILRRDEDAELLKELLETRAIAIRCKELISMVLGYREPLDPVARNG